MPLYIYIEREREREREICLFVVVLSVTEYPCYKCNRLVIGGVEEGELLFAECCRGTTFAQQFECSPRELRSPPSIPLFKPKCLWQGSPVTRKEC